MSVQVSCPGCGAAITFKVGSAIVAVCPYCRSAVARGDRNVEDLGKVAALADTDSLLEVGRTGRYHGVPFELTGRTQLGHEAGGAWDEWYAHFADGRWGWLAEAQGRFYLTFEKDTRKANLLDFRDLKLGNRLVVPGLQVPLTASEKGEARAVSAEGEIPFRFVPDSTYLYADLSGPHGEFGTIDYSEDRPRLFIGQEVTLDDLGLPATAKPARREARQVEGVHLSCPNCGAALALRAPDKTQRVACPSCASLLDVKQGTLRFLKALTPSRIKPIIPLGATGQLQGNPWLNIGFMRRGTKVEGVKYYWEEYLLYHERLGFRWLVRTDNHWSFVEPLPLGRVNAGRRSANYQGEEFKIFQRGMAHVEHVLGEFYWKVEVGETAEATDFIRPPRMLSREVSHHSTEGQKGEINWSLGTYLPVDDVEKAFGVKGLPRPGWDQVAPNQVFPHKRIYLYWLLVVAAAVVLFILVNAVNPGRKVFEKNYMVQVNNNQAHPQVIFDEKDTFPLHGWHNVRISARSDIDNTWLEIEGDLINKDTDQVQPFGIDLGYYHGVEDGEAWSEGSQDSSTYLSAPPAGTYMLRMEFLGEKPSMQTSVRVVIEQGVTRFLPWFLTVCAISVIPLLVAIYHVIFERNRWDGSPFSPFHSK
jgi:hypothetical protein